MYKKIIMEKYIAVLDLGTESIRGVLAVKNSIGSTKIIASESVHSDGIARGLIINVDLVAKAIKDIGLALEKKSGKKVEKFFVGSAGCQVYAKNINPYKKLLSKDIFTAEHVQALYDESNSEIIATDIKLIEVRNQGYILDDEFAVVDPVGAHGVKLLGDYMVYGIKQYDYETIEKCLYKAGYILAGVRVNSLDVCDAVLTNSEKKTGVVSVDMGAGKTSVVVYYQDKVKRIAVLPFGGSAVTNDIANGYKILHEKAEKAKVAQGSAVAELQIDDCMIVIPATDGWEKKEISAKTLAFIIQARMDEIVANVMNQIEKSGCYDKLGSGVVLTGGGSELKDVMHLVKLRTGLNVRLGLPKKELFANSESLSNMQNYCDALGILLNSNENCTKVEEFKTLNDRRTKYKNKAKVERTGNLFESLRKTVDNFFDDDDKSM